MPWLVLVDYPDEATAELAESSAIETGIAVRRMGPKLAAVLAPEPQAVANVILDAALRGER